MRKLLGLIIAVLLLVAVLAAGYILVLRESPERRMNRLRMEAVHYLKSGETEQALFKLTRLHDMAPDNADVNHLLARIYEQTGKLDKALEHATACRALKPEEARFTVDLGRILAEVGRLDDAVRELISVADREAYGVGMTLGRIAQERPNTEAAIRRYEYALRYAQDSEEEYRALRALAAIKEQKRILASDRMDEGDRGRLEEDITEHLERARAILRVRATWDEVQKPVRRAQEEALICLLLKETDDARRILTDAAGTAPPRDRAPLEVLLGQIALGEQREEESWDGTERHHFKAALDLDDSVATYLRIAETYLDAGKPDDAIDVLSIDNWPEAKGNEQTKEQPAKERTAPDERDLTPEERQAVDMVIGLAHLRAGSEDDARGRLEKVHRALVNSDGRVDPVPLFNLATRCLAVDPDSALGMVYLKEALGEDPSRRLLVRAAWVIARAKEAETAYTLVKEHLGGFLSSEKEDEVLWAADVLNWLGKEERALEILGEAEERFAASAGYHSAVAQRALLGALGHQARASKAKDQSDGAADEEEKKSLLARAEEHLAQEAKLLDRAERGLRRAVDLDPSTGRRVILGDFYLRRSDLSRAMTEYLAAYIAEPFGPDLVARIRALLGTETEANAGKPYDWFRVLRPCFDPGRVNDDDLRRFAHGCGAFFEGRFDQVADALDPLGEVSGFQPVARYISGAAQDLRGKRDDALRRMEEILSTNGAFEPAHLMLAYMLAIQGRPGEAIVRLETLKKLHPDSVWGSLLEASAHRLNREFSKAERTCRDVIHKVPGLAQAYIELALTLNATGRKDDAIRVLETGPENYEAFRMLGALYAQKEKSQDAIEYLERAYRVRPGPRELLAIVQTLIDAKDFVRARTKIDTYAKPGSYTCDFFHGMVAAAEGLLEDARERYLACVKLQPENFTPRNNLADVLARMAVKEKGNVTARKDLLAEARGHADSAFELAPNLWQVKDTRGWILHLQADVKRETLRLKVTGGEEVSQKEKDAAEEEIEKLQAEAKESLEAALEASKKKPGDPGNPSVLYHLAEVEWALGNTPKARGLLRTIRAAGRTFPEDDEADTLFRRIEAASTE